MNTKTSITIFIVIILLALAVYSYFTNDVFRTKIEKVFAIESKQDMPETSKYIAIFVIFDPSGSALHSYSVPHITTDFISSLIDRIVIEGYGELWLTYIVKDAYKNKVLNFAIPKPPQFPVRPIRSAGEPVYKFNRRLRKYISDSLNYTKELLDYKELLNKKKNVFLENCQEMINAGYAPKNPSDDFSDVIGSLNAATRSLSTVPSKHNYFRYILLISDGEQDLPPGSEPKTLNPIPGDITLIIVNHSGSKNSCVKGRAIEVDNLDRALNIIFQFY